MQDTLFVPWPRGPRWPRPALADEAAMGPRGEGLKPDAALTSPRSAGAPKGAVEGPAGRAINAGAWDTTMPSRPGAGRRRSVAAIIVARSIAERVPAQGRREARGFCGVEALPWTVL
jgi:hypothetical protein